MIARLRRELVAVGAALALGACSGNPGTASANGECAPPDTPPLAVPLDSVVDSTAFVEALAAAAPEWDGQLIWLVRHRDSTHVRLLKPAADSARQARLIGLLVPTIRPFPFDEEDAARVQSPRSTGGGGPTDEERPPSLFRVVADLVRGEPAVRVTSAHMCKPELLNRSELGQLMSEAYQPGRSGTAVLMLWVDVTGSLQKIELSRSSGDPVLDALAVSIGGAARFRPALVEGEPVAVRMGFPVVFGRP